MAHPYLPEKANLIGTYIGSFQNRHGLFIQ